MRVHVHMHDAAPTYLATSIAHSTVHEIAFFPQIYRYPVLYNFRRRIDFGENKGTLRVPSKRSTTAGDVFFFLFNRELCRLLYKFCTRIVDCDTYTPVRENVNEVGLVFNVNISTNLSMYKL